MRLINENQKLSRADRMRSQELAERKSELVHLRDAMNDLKLNTEIQAARIDYLINEKKELIREKSETEALSFANLQAAAEDYERLQKAKYAVDQQLKGLLDNAHRRNKSPINRTRAASSRVNEHKDDLTRIEGIGPKIQSLLSNERIRTYRKLANTSVDRLQKILLEAGGHYHMHDPTTWPDQARLAADGNWKKLVRLQDSLVGGRPA